MDEDTLLQTHIIFRHGEKLLDHQATYPTDPHAAMDDFFPYKRGELTLDGRRKAYKLGKDLHKLYKIFLGPKFYSKIVEATTSNTPRTEMTLLCVLAALFPANNDSELNEDTTWQPVLFNRIIEKDDDLILIFYKHPEITSYEFMNNDDDTQKIYDYINLHSGLPKDRGFYLVYLSFVLQSAKGLKLPDWTDSIWPEPVTTLARKWADGLFSHKLKTIIGKLLSKIISDSKKLYKGTTFDDTKMYIYSGHDFNVCALLHLILNPKDFEEIEYLSCIVIEVHKIRDELGIKFLYKGGEEDEFKYLQIPGHDSFISLEEFEKFVNYRLSGQT